MKNRQDKSSFVEWTMANGWLSGQFLSLIDVGASGGIDRFWRQFEPHLEAIGFDPLIAEVKRLTASEKNKRVRYEAGWVGDGTQRSYPSGQLYGFPSTSASAAAKISQKNYIQTHFNAGEKIVYSDRQLSLDTFLADDDINRFDALKIDTDGFDFFVLEGAKKLLNEGELLLVECECQMHEARPGWPCFADIDMFMRRAGYRLVDIQSWTYTRACLPGRFMYDIHAQTEHGQVQASDAVYMLDPSLDDAAMHRLKFDANKVLKLAILQEAFGYPDLAAATLLAMHEQNMAPAGFPVDAALDRLVPTNPFGAKTYKNYIELFELDPDNFLASRWNRTNSKPVAAPTEPLSDIRLNLVRMESDWKKHGARLESEGNGTMIYTPEAAWHYAAVAPLGKLGSHTPREGNLFVRVHLRFIQGNPTISLFHAQSNTIHAEIEIASSSEVQILDLLLDPTTARAPDHLLIRNGGMEGQGCLILEKIELVAINDALGW